MSQTRLKTLFLESSAGRIFLLLRAPEESKHCVLFVPAFAEEMNKSRRQITETAMALTDAGHAVLLVDLFGTGDSEGEFSDATWETWKADIGNALIWAGRAGFMPDSVVATRLGCGLAAESLRESGRSVARTVFWQPVESGRQHMTQFLRLRVAATMMQAGKKETVQSLKQRLASGEILEIAGYPLSPTLFAAIDAVDLNLVLDPCLGRLQLIEVGQTNDGKLSLPGQRLVASADAKDIPVQGHRITGDPFWNATEIVVNSELKELTTRYLIEDRS